MVFILNEICMHTYIFTYIYVHNCNKKYMYFATNSKIYIKPQSKLN